MRALFAVAVCLLACQPGVVSSPEGPVQQVTTRARGLWTQPSPVGGAPDGALLQADNVVITSDGTVETRRGTEVIATRAMTKLIPHAGVLLGHNRSTGSLAYSNAGGTTWTEYTGTYLPPTSDQIRAAALNSNVYFTSSGAPYRLDAITGTPEPQGIPDGQDVQAALSGATGSAIAGNTQVAYRVVFGKRDANGTLILGGPSGRTTLQSPAVTIAAGSLARAGTTVTATLTAGVTNPFAVGETIYLSPGEANFPVGNKVVTAVGASTLTYTEAGAAVSSTAQQVIAYPTRDVALSYTIPDDLPTGAFVQAYRSQSSASAATSPDDELGLVFEGDVPATRSITGLSRTTNVVTATTSAAHGYSVGQIVRVTRGVEAPGGGAATKLAVGTSGAATSPDGITWTARTMPAGSYYAVVWAGTQFVAVGNSVAATSPDGITWTARTIPAGNYRGLAWNGSLLVAVEAAAGATSSDGITWTSRPSLFGAQAITWSGTVFCAVGSGVAYTSADGITWTSRTIGPESYTGVAWNGSVFCAIANLPSTVKTSPDGITWTSRTPPSGSFYYAITWGGTLFVMVGDYIAATSPDGITWTSRTIPAAIYRDVSWSASGFVAVGDSLVAATSTDGITWTSRSIPSGLFQASTAMSDLSFGSGEKTIASVPLTTTFTYAETGTDGSVTAPGDFTAIDVTPITGYILDQVPSSFIGAALYTNPGQGGMASAASQVWGATDVAMFREHAFYANITYPSSADVYLLAVSDGTSGGIRANDTITIDGITYTASATTESVSARTFRLSSSTSASTRLFETSASLIRILNRTHGNTVAARDTASATDAGPRIHLEETNTTTTLTVSFSGDEESWSVANLQAPVQRLNELRWSSPQQPDSVPLLNYKWIGDADKAILRVIATRNALYVLKEDGIWIVTGYTSPWSIDPFDPTVILLAPETAVVLDNQVFCLSRHGVMRISDTGVTVVSRPIEDLVNAALTSTMRSVTAAYAFSVADERDHKFYLWLPEAVSDTQATAGYVYDLYTDAWTARTDAMAHGVSNPADDRLYFVSGSSVRQERKAFQPTDYADESTAVTIASVSGAAVTLSDASSVLVGDVVAQGNTYGTVISKAGNVVTLDRSAALTAGAATAYRYIATAVKWMPKFGNDPSLSYRFREVGVLFRDVYFAAASLSFSTDWVPTLSTISLSGADYGWTTSFPTLVPTETSPTPMALRALVDLEHARATQLYVLWQHAQAWAPMKIQALTTVANPVSTRIGR